MVKYIKRTMWVRAGSAPKKIKRRKSVRTSDPYRLNFNWNGSGL